MTTMTDSAALNLLAQLMTADNQHTHHEAFSHIAARLREPAGVDYNYRAIARLIAVAPELLGQHEADMVDLDLLAKAIHAGDPMPELVIRVTDMLNRKRAVIAKATTP